MIIWRDFKTILHSRGESNTFLLSGNALPFGHAFRLKRKGLRQSVERNSEHEFNSVKERKYKNHSSYKDM